MHQLTDNTTMLTVHSGRTTPTPMMTAGMRMRHGMIGTKTTNMLSIVASIAPCKWAMCKK